MHLKLENVKVHYEQNNRKLKLARIARSKAQSDFYVNEYNVQSDSLSDSAVWTSRRSSFHPLQVSTVKNLHAGLPCILRDHGSIAAIFVA